MYEKVRLVRATGIQAEASLPFKKGDPNPLAKAHAELLEKDDSVPRNLKEKSSRRHMILQGGSVILGMYLTVVFVFHIAD